MKTSFNDYFNKVTELLSEKYTDESELGEWLTITFVAEKQKEGLTPEECLVEIEKVAKNLIAR